MSLTALDKLSAGVRCASDTYAAACRNVGNTDAIIKQTEWNRIDYIFFAVFVLDFFFYK